MSIRKKMATAAAAVTIVTGGLLVATPQAAFAAYDCTVGHTQQGFAEARCFNTSPGGDKYRIVWGCSHIVTAAFRNQYGNVASVAAGNSSTIPNCHWYEKAWGSRYVETLWS